LTSCSGLPDFVPPQPHFIAIATAVITCTFVARATREREADRIKDDLSDRQLMERRFDELESKLDELAEMRGASA
jgi:hypothetical protein